MVGWILDGTIWSLFIDCIGFVSAFLSRSQQNAFLSLLLLLLSWPTVGADMLIILLLLAKYDFVQLLLPM